jgi:anti-anti-sigma factor
MGNNDIIPGFDNEKDESLDIKLENASGIESGIILTLNGRIDTDNSAYFQKHIQKLVEAGFMRLIFNCAGLNYVSSTGIGSFTSFLKTLKPKGGDLVLLGIQPKVFEVFQLLGFSQFFAIKKNLEEAIGFFNSEVKKDNSALWKTC